MQASGSCHLVPERERHRCKSLKCGLRRAGPGTASDLKALAALEGLEPEREAEGPTMMAREARQLMLSGQGQAGLELFKVCKNEGIFSGLGLYVYCDPNRLEP